MTSEQIAKLRAESSFMEVKNVLRQEAQRLGRTISGNETIAELIAKATDAGTPATTTAEDTQTTGSGSDTPPEAKDDKGKGEGNGEGKGKGKPTPQPLPSFPPAPAPVPESGESKPKPEGKEELPPPPDELPLPDGEDGEPSAEEKAEEEARKEEEEARKKREEMMRQLRQAEDELRRKEEARRKAEEEARKKREEEARKKAEAEAEKRRKEEEERRKKVKKEAGAHKQLNELIETLQCTGLALLVGPAGTGKSTLAQSACCSLFNCKRNDAVFNKKYAQISFSPDTTSGEMIGRVDVNGVFHESEVTRVYRDGGLILFDELDDADASLLVKLNTALANGVLVTPNGPVVRNAETYIVCSANTFGTGPDAMYVGRNRLDAATLDRFICSTIEVNYDLALEQRLATAAGCDSETVTWLMNGVKNLRVVISKSHLRRVCSTRFVSAAAKWLARGKGRKFVTDKLFLGWSESEKNAAKECFAA